MVVDLVTEDQVERMSELWGAIWIILVYLIVHEDTHFRKVLTRKLQQRGYLVLAARNRAEAFEIAIRQSRSIDLLLAADSDDDRVMAARLKPYRSDMNVIHVGTTAQFRVILRKVSRVLEPPYRSS